MMDANENVMASEKKDRVTSETNHGKDSSVNWTKSQTAAINVKADRILVSAAAGSGKSTVLTERIIRRILSGEGDVSALLIVTFTKEAALQLRQKITQKLSRAVSEHPGNKNLRNQLLKLPSAQITTIHAFCYSLVKKNFQILGLPSSVRISDETAATLLKKQVMDNFIEECYGGLFEHIPDFSDFCDNFVSGLDDSLTEMFLEIYDKMRNYPDISEKRFIYLDENGSIGDTEFFKIIRNKLLIFIDYYKKLLEDGYSEIMRSDIYGKKFGEIFRTFISYIEKTENCAKYGNYRELSEAIRSMPELPRVVIKDKDELCEFYRASLREFITECKKEYIGRFFGFSDEEIKDLGMMTSDISGKMIRFLKEFDRRYSEAKLKKYMLDYNDLEHMALRLLYESDGSVSALGEKISSAYEEIFIDEFQDVNPLQNKIFSALGIRCPVFMVGDIKQSIYNFRGAVPEIFSEYKRKFNKFNEIGEEGCGQTQSEEKTASESVNEPYQSVNFSGWTDALNISGDLTDSSESSRCVNSRINKKANFTAINDSNQNKSSNDIAIFLSDNFRSQKHITDFANVVTDAMFYSPENSIYDFRIPYSKEDRLRFHLGEKSSDSFVEVINVSPSKKDDGEEKDKPIVIEAEAVAEKIYRLCKNGADPKEMTILLRSPKDKAVHFEKALKKRGIPVFSGKTEKLFDTPEIQLVLCLLNVCDNPNRDIFLAGALKSQVFGVTLSELIAIRIFKKDSDSLYEALEEYTLSNNFEKGMRFIDFITRMRNYCLKYPIEKVIWKLYSETSLFSLLGDDEAITESAGNQVKENLVSFYEFAVNVSENGNGSLYSLIERIRMLTETGSSPDIAKGKGTGVKIMSVHAAKGLEFQYCFLCGTASRFNSDDTKNNLLFDPEIGFGMRIKDKTGLSATNTLYRAALSAKAELSQKEEEMRLLYVALTRAKKELYIYSSAEKFEDMVTGCRMKAMFVHPYVFLDGNDYIKWILTAVSAKTDIPVRYKIIDSDRMELEAGKKSDGNAESIVYDSNRADSEKLYKELCDRIEFEYPYSYMITLPSKIAVSNLTPDILDAESYSDSFLRLGEESSFVFPDDTERFAGVKSQAALTVSPADNYRQTAIDSKKISKLKSEDPEADFASEAGREITANKVALENIFPEGDSVSDKDNLSELKIPEFISGEKENEAALKGTATHVFMQFCDFTNVEKYGVEYELERLLKKRYITETFAALTNRKAAEKFFRSEIYREMRAAETLEREYRFNVKLPASMFTKDAEKKKQLENESVFVQGVVDCYFRNRTGNITIVDYKTDFIPLEVKGNAEKENEFFVNRHKAQLTYYKTALEMITGQKVSRTVIYSFSAARSIEI